MTKIEWTERVWNPVRGCSLVSAGCANCYAMKQAHRFHGEGQAYEGLTELGPQGPRWTGKIRLVPQSLEAPLRWKKPLKIFVNSMSDLFHEDITQDFIFQVLTTIWQAKQHTFQVLTKRPERMKAVMEAHYKSIQRQPLENLWLGVSVEDQQTADERIPILLQTPAAVRFISAEPLLGLIDLGQLPNRYSMGEGQPYLDALRGSAWIVSGPDYYDVCNIGSQIDWVIVGGESGPKARPTNIAHIRSIKDQCQAAKVPVFVKQLGSHPYEDDANSKIILIDKKGGDPAEWPSDLRVREFPR